MNHPILAALLAAAPLTAGTASAAPSETIYRTYALACDASSPFRSETVYLTNTTPHAIPAGTRITAVLLTASGSRYVMRRAQGAIAPGTRFSLGTFDEVKGCKASVTLTPNLKVRIDAKFGKLAR